MSSTTPGEQQNLLLSGDLKLNDESLIRGIVDSENIARIGDLNHSKHFLSYCLTVAEADSSSYTPPASASQVRNYKHTQPHLTVLFLVWEISDISFIVLWFRFVFLIVWM